MAFRFRKLLVAFISVFFANYIQGAPPSLSINSEDYKYDLSITAVLVENCVELTDPNNLLIAYINGQMRGFVNSSTLVGNRHMAFLTVYSNVPSGDTIKFQIYKASADKLIPVKTTLLFQDDGIYGNPSVPVEMHTNNRPTNLTLSTLQIPEGQGGNPNLLTISAVDIDKDNTLSYTLVPGTGDNDNASFKVVGNQLQYNGKVNTLAQDTFKIRLRVADNFGCSTEKAFALVVDKVNDAPTAIRLSDSTFFENVAGPFIGSFSASDPDLVDFFRYSFVSGQGDDDNSKFTIIDSNLYFKTTANYEVKRMYNIRCRVTDFEGLTYDTTFTLYVKDNNDPPTSIVLSNTKVFENEPKDQFVAKLSTIDEDAVDRYEYTFANIGTNDNFSFSISNDTLWANKVFDYETKNGYIVYLTSTDSSGVPTTKFFTITIKDTLDAPTDLLLSNATIVENAPPKTFIGLLSTVDANAPSTYTYSLVAGKGSADNASFLISKDSLYSKEVFDYEVKKSYSIRIKTALPNSMNIEKEFGISILDQVSTNIVLNNTKVYENEPLTQFVAKISTVSVDVSDQYEYSFGNVGTNDNSSFTISNDTLKANKVFDFEAKNSYIVYLTSTSLSGVSITRPFSIAIKDTLDVPTDLVLDNLILTENLPAKTFIGKLNTLDANTQPVLYTYTTVPGVGSTDNGRFLISNDSIYSNEAFDFETKASYTVRVRSTLVNNMYTEKAFTITIKDVSSTDIALNNTKVFENEPKTQFVAKIATISQDFTDAYRYTFGNVGTNDNSSFTISNDTLWANKVFDFENKNSYVVYLVSTSISGLSITRPFTILIQDTLDVPTDLNLDNLSMEENAPIGTFIGKLSTVDANTQPVLYAYTFESGAGSTENGRFRISNDSLYNNEVFNYENRTSYSIRVRSTLVNGMHVEKAFALNVLNVNERPIFLSLSKDSIAENTNDSTYVCALSTTDEDRGDAFVYSLVSGANDAQNQEFVIRGNSLFLVRAADFEKNSAYKIRLRTTDKGGLYLESEFNIHIKDVNERPHITVKTYEILELSALETELGTVEVKDVDQNQAQAFQLLTEAPFSIHPSTGMLALAGSIDYEKKKEYHVWVKTTDSGFPSLSDSVAIKILVIDEIEDDKLPSADLVSPNDDGKNDTWNITNVALYKDYSVNIIDEYGQLVYSVSGNYNNDWNAKLNGEALPSGVYYYVLKHNTNNKIFKGYITVVR